MKKNFKLLILTNEKSWYTISLVERILNEDIGLRIYFYIKDDFNYFNSFHRNMKEMGFFWVIGKIIKRLISRLKFFKYKSAINLVHINSYDEILNIKDLDLTIAYNTGILKPSIFNHPKKGTICAHPAILPFGRGIAGADKAILNNDPIGVSIFKLDKGIDTGDIYCQKEISKENFYSFSQLKYKFSNLSIDLTINAMYLVISGKLPNKQKKVLPYITLTAEERLMAKKKWQTLFCINKKNEKEKKIKLRKNVKSYFLDISKELYWGDDSDCRFWILEKFNKTRNKTILDIGCQTGVILSHLDHSNNLFGIDVSSKYINIAKLNNSNCHFQQGSMLKLPYKKNTFDIIFMLNSLPGWDFEEGDNQSREMAVNEAHRVLKNDGLLVITTPNGDSRYYKNFQKGSIFKLLPLLKNFSLELYGWNNSTKFLFMFPKIFINLINKLLSSNDFFWSYLKNNLEFNRINSKSIVVFAKKVH